MANRGEIAVRVCRAAKSLGLSTVVVYTEQDEGAWHMKNPLVDEAVKLAAGPTPIAPYLDIESLIKICALAWSSCLALMLGYLSWISWRDVIDGTG